MKQFKALLLKEYWTNKKWVYMPLIISISLFVLFGIIAIIATFHPDGEVNTIDFWNDYENVNTFDMGMNYETEITLHGRLVHSYALGMWMLIGSTLLILICYIVLTTGVINDDFKKKCIVFHTALPVSFLKRTMAKFAFIIGTLPLQMFGLSIINLLIVITFFSKNVTFHQFGYAFLGLLQASISLFIWATLLLSIIWFFSAVFKNKTINYIILTYILSTSILGFIDWYFKVEIVKYLVLPFLKMLFKFDINFTISSIMILGDINNAVFVNWLNIFSTGSLWKLGFAAAFFTLGKNILSKREIA